jgi:hypothetical protein
MPERPTLPEEELHERALTLIKEGRLPANPPNQVWGGYGKGVHCSLCDQPIQPEQVQMEVEFSDDGKRSSFVFHLVCESVWLRECARLKTRSP